MVYCAVFDCNNRSKTRKDGENFRKVGFFALPSVIEGQCDKTQEVTAARRKKWQRRIRRAKLNEDATHYKVCSDHFVSDKLLSDVPRQQLRAGSQFAFASELRGPNGTLAVRVLSVAVIVVLRDRFVLPLLVLKCRLF